MSSQRRRESTGDGAAAGATADAPPGVEGEVVMVTSGSDSESDAGEDLGAENVEALTTTPPTSTATATANPRRRRRQQQRQRQPRQQQDPFAAWTEAPVSNPSARLYDAWPPLGPSTLVPLTATTTNDVGADEDTAKPFPHLRNARGNLFVPARQGDAGARSDGGDVPWVLPAGKPLSFPLRLGKVLLPVGAGSAFFSGRGAASRAAAAAARRCPIRELSFGYYRGPPPAPTSSSALFRPVGPRITPGAAAAAAAASGEVTWNAIEIPGASEDSLKHATLRAVVVVGGGGVESEGEGGKESDDEESDAGDDRKSSKKRKKATKNERKKKQATTLEVHVPVDRDTPEASAALALGFLAGRGTVSFVPGESTSASLVRMGSGQIGVEVEVRLTSEAFASPEEAAKKGLSGSSRNGFGWHETEVEGDEGLTPLEPPRRGGKAATDDGEALLALLQATLTLGPGVGAGKEQLRLGPDSDGGLNAPSLGNDENDDDENDDNASNGVDALPPPTEKLLPHTGSVSALYSSASLHLTPRRFQRLQQSPNPPGLRTRLLPHQLAALRWARDRESRSDARRHGALLLSPLWVQLRASDGQIFYVYRGAGAARAGAGGKRHAKASPRLSSNFYCASWCRSMAGAAGGMLCDEMGAGKSLTMLSLFLGAPCPRGWAAAPEAKEKGATCPSPLDAPTPVKTTLLVVPSNLLLQWLGEVSKHVEPGALSACVYEGTSRSRVLAEQAKASASAAAAAAASTAALMQQQGKEDEGGEMTDAKEEEEEGEKENEGGKKRRDGKKKARVEPERRSQRARKAIERGDGDGDDEKKTSSAVRGYSAFFQTAWGTKVEFGADEAPTPTPMRVADADLCLVTYETLRGERFPSGPPSSSAPSSASSSTAFTPLSSLGFWRLALDEAQLVAASNSAAALAASSIYRRNAWTCSGTPLSRSLGELAGLCEFLNLGEFADPAVFSGALRMSEAGSPARPICALFRAVALRRTREEARLEMPPCELADVVVDLTRPERVAYDEELRALRAAAAAPAVARAGAAAAGAAMANATTAAAAPSASQRGGGRGGGASGGGLAAARRSAALRSQFNRTRQAASHPLLAGPSAAASTRGRGRGRARRGGSAPGDGPASPSGSSRPMPMSQIMSRLVDAACHRYDSAARAAAQASLLDAAVAAARGTGGGRAGAASSSLRHLEDLLSSIGKEALLMMTPRGRDPAALAARRSAVGGLPPASAPVAALGGEQGTDSARWPRDGADAVTAGAQILAHAFLSASAAEGSSPALGEGPNDSGDAAVDAAWAKVFVEGLDLLAAAIASSDDGNDGEGERSRRSLEVRRSASSLRAALGLEDPDAALEAADAAAAAAAADAERVRRAVDAAAAEAAARAEAEQQEAAAEARAAEDAAAEAARAEAARARAIATAAAEAAAQVRAAAAASSYYHQRFSRRVRGMHENEELGGAAARAMVVERGRQRDSAARVLLRQFRAELERAASSGGRGRGRGGTRPTGAAASSQQAAGAARASAAAAEAFHALRHALNQSVLNMQERTAAAAAEEEGGGEEEGEENGDDENENGEETSCPVCLEGIRFQGNATTRAAVTPCGHSFCLACIREALYSFGKCPLCRTPVRHDQLMVVGEEEEKKSVDGDRQGGGEENNANANNNDNNALSTSLIAHELRLDTLRSFHGAKMAALCAAVSECAASGGKAVVFSSWSKLLTLAGHALNDAGIKSVSLSGADPSRRASALEAFRSTGADAPAVLLLLMSTGGGAAGLDLGHATTAILLDPSFNPALEAQAAARIQRLGQTRETRVVRILSSRTIDEAVVSVARERARNSGGGGGGGGEVVGTGGGETTMGTVEIVDERLVSVVLAAHP